MDSKKTEETPPPPPNTTTPPPEEPLSYQIFWKVVAAQSALLKAMQAVLDTMCGERENALQVIKEICKHHSDSAILHKYHAGISYLCASLADDPQEINDRSLEAIECVRRSAKFAPKSTECALFFAYFLYMFSFDADGLHKAIEECSRGLAIKNPVEYSTINWRDGLPKLIGLCKAKLKALNQESVSSSEQPLRSEKHHDLRFNQVNLQQRMPVEKFTELAKQKSVAAPDSSKNTYEILNTADGEVMDVMKVDGSLPAKAKPGPDEPKWFFESVFHDKEMTYVYFDKMLDNALKLGLEGFQKLVDENFQNLLAAQFDEVVQTLFEKRHLLM